MVNVPKHVQKFGKVGMKKMFSPVADQVNQYGIQENFLYPAVNCIGPYKGNVR